MMHFTHLFNFRRRPAAGVRAGAGAGVIVLLLTVVAAAGFAAGSKEPMTPPAKAAATAEMPAKGQASVEGMESSEGGTETAVLAGGCFWGMEAVFERLAGVLDVVSGYSGDRADTATYQTVSSGKTGHAESVRIVFDPNIVSFETLLEVFFNVAHDPTQLNFQGPDVGTQYRSVIFYANDEQKQTAERVIEKLDAGGRFEKAIVTEVVPLTEFYPAEDYHQDFMRRHPGHPYIAYWDVPKIKHLEEAYPELLKEQ
jgi:peptide-methionine (S)-S-oxide reductase